MPRTRRSTWVTSSKWSPSPENPRASWSGASRRESMDELIQWGGSFGFVVLAILIIVLKSIRIVNEYERGVLFRLGRVASENLKAPGLRILIPFIDRMVKVDLRTVTHDVPPQETITKDNVTIKVNAVIYFNVMN